MGRIWKPALLYFDIAATLILEKFNNVWVVIIFHALKAFIIAIVLKVGGVTAVLIPPMVFIDCILFQIYSLIHSKGSEWAIFIFMILHEGSQSKMSKQE